MYADGCDASVMDQLGSNMIVGKALAERYGINLGDDILLTENGAISLAIDEYVASYEKSHPDETVSRRDVLTKYQKELFGKRKSDAH